MMVQRRRRSGQLHKDLNFPQTAVTDTCSHSPAKENDERRDDATLVGVTRHAQPERERRRSSHAMSCQ